MDVTAGNRESRNLFQGMNVLWTLLAATFIIGIGATAADHFMRDDLLGHVYVGPIGFGISGLLVLASMALFIVARVVQLVARALTNQPHPHV